MHLIAPLASGMVGAEDGTVDIFTRGTSTRATLYNDFEGTIVVGNTAALSLDENGRPDAGMLYVNEYVNCIVRNSSGVIQAEFVAGFAASGIEVISQSFTGIDYESAASGPSKPVPLSVILDRWFTSTSALDWKVDIDGTDTILSTAIAPIAGLLFNVKSPAYGATGDGSKDDTSAITSAMTAAQNAGGGVVFFPAGTYRITSALVPGGKVSFWGVGSSGSIIQIDHATANAFTFSNASTKEPQYMKGLQIKAAQANSGIHVSIAAVAVISIDDCYIGGSNTTGQAIKVNSGSTTLRIRNSGVEVGGATATALMTSAGITHAELCRFIAPATLNGNLLTLEGSGGSVWGCQFVNSAATAGTYNDIFIDATGAMVAGCIFGSSGGATVTAIASLTIAGTTETGNQIASNLTRAAFSITAAATTHDGVWQGTRERFRYYTADDGAAVTINPNLYAELEVRRSNNGNQTLTLTTPLASNMHCCIVYNNDHGAGGGTITWAGNVEPAAANFTVNANKVTYHFFRSVQTKSLNYYWAQYGTLANQNP